MTEVKRTKIDRLYVDKKAFDDFNRLKEKDSPFFGVHYHELFVAAMVIGFYEGCQIEITSRKELFFEKDLTREENALVRAIAVAEKGDIGVFLNKQEIYNIAEKYATGGISLLKAKALSGAYGSYAKRLESDLLGAFKKIKEEIPPGEVYIEDDSLPTLEALTVSELAQMNESNLIEFKETMYWDSNRRIKNEQLKIAIARELAAFMNSKGGILLIGVKDDHTILGIQPDLDVMHNSKDDFELTFTNIVRDYLGKVNRAYADLKFEKIKDKEVALIRIRASPHEVYVKIDKNKEDFCIRTGNSCQTLLPSEASVYIRDHWTNR